MGLEASVVASEGVFHDQRDSSVSQYGFMPLREAAKWAGVSARTMKRWFGRGLHSYQAGPREKVLVCREDIVAFLQRKRVFT